MKKKIWIIITLVLLVLGSGAVVWISLLNPETFVTTMYEIPHSNVTEPIRIAHLSDIHNQEYGENNIDLIDTVKSQSPDLIFITGDSVSRQDEEVESAVSLVRELAGIGPVYFSYGNHEIMNEENYGRDIGKMFEEAGAVILDFAYEDIDIKDQKLRIGGLYGYCLPEKYLETKEADPEECAFLNEFQNTDRYTMLLCHMPVCWIQNEGLNEWNVDAVFAGHSHGGQMILPMLGPVFAPDQGWFPDKVSGHFQSDDGKKNLIVSRGLGDSVKVPRVNNEPELVVVDIFANNNEISEE